MKPSHHQNSVRRSIPGAARTAALILGLAALARADIVVQTQPAWPNPDRFVSVSATLDATNDSSSDNNASGGAYSKSLDAEVASTLLVEAHAKQDSIIPNLVGPSMSGSGSADASAMVDSGSVGNYYAQSFFDVFFEVDLNADYLFTGSLSFWSDDPYGFGSAYFTLSFANGADIFSASNEYDNQGSTGFAGIVGLVAGFTYRLQIDAHVGSEIVEGVSAVKSEATWQFNLGPNTSSVPEPSACLLVLTGAIGLGVTFKRRKRH